MKRKALQLLLLILCGAALLWHTQSSQSSCTQKTLTDVPDDSFARRAAKADADMGEAAQPMQTKLVCLTFDDGPSKTTPMILEELAAEKVPATFFVMAADNNREYLPLVAKEAAAGHQIALHTCCHQYSRIYQSPEAYWLDIKELRRQLSPYVDVETLYWLRFPGGSTNTVSCRYGGSGMMEKLKQQAEEKGYHYVDWNACAEDAAGGHPNADAICKNVIRDAEKEDTCVVLMHDTAATENTAKALPAIVRWFKQQNYRFCTVEGLFEEING